ncbi:Protein PLASTID MOVEMENT IMPAIRED 1 [Euphorbia peplus]|nr:Protein PLASTID MOVEMENT IMPAIRED 1 [Euphorbia peplus]
MAATSELPGRRNSSTQLLEELEELSQSLYQTHTSTAGRRTASLVLPRTSVPALISVDETKVDMKPSTKLRSRRMSLSPWRSRPKPDDENQQKEKKEDSEKKLFETEDATEKKGIWKWKPIRALSRIGMEKLSCLFSVEVVAVQGLPASMNGLRLSVCIRKKETKDGAVHTMPSRVSQGAADFEETLFVRCHVYCTPGQGRQLKFEPRPFWIYAFAVDAEELDFGRGSVDLSYLIQESMEKNQEGARIRQWDTSFNLSGKAKGGELVLKLGFQIMDKDGGIDIYSQADGFKSGKSRNSPSFRQKQSKMSFSVPSPRMTSRAEAWTPSETKATADLQGMDELDLDEPASVPALPRGGQKLKEPEPKIEELELPDFEVVDKGVEIQEKEGTANEDSEEHVEAKSTSGEVVKEIIHDQLHLTRLNELDSIAEQIKALESLMAQEKNVEMDDESESPKLDADEETVTKEFLQLLEEEDETYKSSKPEIPNLQEDSTEADSSVYLSDLGKGLGCVVQTRNGGYLAAMNPLDTLVSRKDPPKLAMQLSKPVIIPSEKSMSGVELFQRMAAAGFEELSSQISSLMPMEELMGKTAEQIAFEGIASAIIQGRNKEGASSSAARTVASVKSMATAMSTGRKERISTGIWNADENPLALEEVLAFALAKIEAMSVEALKIQAEIPEEEPPFDVSPVNEPKHHLASAIPLEDWIEKNEDSATITMAVIVQLRDPLRRYEAVGGPVIALIPATCIDMKEDKYDEEKKFKVASLHVGGLKVKTGEKKNMWDSERQRLTAMQWLVEYGLGKGAKRAKHASAKGQDLLWSISSRIMADMWLKPMRNPDVKFIK